MIKLKRKWLKAKTFFTFPDHAVDQRKLRIKRRKLAHGLTRIVCLTVKFVNHLLLLIKVFLAVEKRIRRERKLAALFTQRELLASFVNLLLLLFMLLLLKWLYHLVKLLPLSLVPGSRYSPHAGISRIHKRRIHKRCILSNWKKSTHITRVFEFTNRPYSYSRYWTGTSLQVRLMRGSLFLRTSLHSKLVPVQYREY